MFRCGKAEFPQFAEDIRGMRVNEPRVHNSECASHCCRPDPSIVGALLPLIKYLFSHTMRDLTRLYGKSVCLMYDNRLFGPRRARLEENFARYIKRLFTGKSN